MPGVNRANPDSPPPAASPGPKVQPALLQKKKKGENLPFCKNLGKLAQSSTLDKPQGEEKFCPSSVVTKKWVERCKDGDFPQGQEAKRLVPACTVPLKASPTALMAHLSNFP